VTPLTNGSRYKWRAKAYANLQTAVATAKRNVDAEKFLVDGNMTAASALFSNFFYSRH
jgi:hypothetical protein